MTRSSDELDHVGRLGVLRLLHDAGHVETGRTSARQGADPQEARAARRRDPANQKVRRDPAGDVRLETLGSC